MDHYVIVQELGKGTHGIVWKTVDKVTSKFWAMKRVLIFYLCPTLTLLNVLFNSSMISFMFLEEILS